MKDEVFSSVGVQDMDTSGYQTSDLDNDDIYWEKNHLVVDTVFTPTKSIYFSPSVFNDFEMVQWLPSRF